MKIIGNQIPQGEVKVSGAKNAATRLLAAALLTDEQVVLHNFPTELVDVSNKSKFIKAIGGHVKLDRKNSLALVESGKCDASSLKNFNFPFRTTYLLAAGQLKQHAFARIPYPGGCKLGERKHDLHIMLWNKLGCKVTETNDYIQIEGRPRGGTVDFPFKTVGGTENALLMGAVSPESTKITNAYVTPEIINLIELLRMMGTQIEVRGSSEIITVGSKNLRGATIRIIPDRIEALTWIIYAALTKGQMTIHDVPFSQMEIPLKHIRDCGVDYHSNSNSVFLSPTTSGEFGIQPFDLACGAHPGIISDMQPFYVLLALKAKGKSFIYDYRYGQRVKYLEELSKFCPGALTWKGGEFAKIEVSGPVNFRAAKADSTDLRGSMAVILAALLAEGESEVSNIQMGLRGYNELGKKLNQLGITFTEN